MLDEHGVRRLH